MTVNSYVIDKRGNQVFLCNFSYTNSEGQTEKCRAPKGCEICGQCSRIDGDHEHGHCTGHLGLNEFVSGIPGREQAKVRDGAVKKQSEVRQQAKLRKDKRNRKS